ncbi:MAG: AlbA family DNA-binding domain-containing protein, partial [Acidimicrobiales bacterium]
MTRGSEGERNLRDFLDFPREDMSTEIKDWLDLAERPVRARLAKELIALANHGGGYLLFGFAEADTSWIPSGACPFDSRRYSPDEVNNILKRHAEPVFECYVHHIDGSGGNPHVVIEVPGGHLAPIRIDHVPDEAGVVANAYYIRKPGPESSPANT